MAEQSNSNIEPESPRHGAPSRRDFANTADWWEALTAAQGQAYIDRWECPPHRAMRGWSGPQDPGFGNG